MNLSFLLDFNMALTSLLEVLSGLGLCRVRWLEEKRLFSRNVFPLELLSTRRDPSRSLARRDVSPPNLILIIVIQLYNVILMLYTMLYYFCSFFTSLFIVFRFCSDSFQTFCRPLKDLFEALLRWPSSMLAVHRDDATVRAHGPTERGLGAQDRSRRPFGLLERLQTPAGAFFWSFFVIFFSNRTAKQRFAGSSWDFRAAHASLWSSPCRSSGPA